MGVMGLSIRIRVMRRLPRRLGLIRWAGVVGCMFVEMRG
jgi:hypothetical protein